MKEKAAREMGIHVIKVGGSMLLRSDLTTMLESLLRSFDGKQKLVIFGGGQLINAVRQWDAIRPMDPAAVHWQCVELLDATFELASRWFESWQPIASEKDLRRILSDAASGTFLVRVGCFYRKDQHHGLPSDWSTTTDAIAAALCHFVGGDRVTLLKSCEVPHKPLHELSDCGIIDAATSHYAERQDVRVSVLGVRQ